MSIFGPSVLVDLTTVQYRLPHSSSLDEQFPVWDEIDPQIGFVGAGFAERLDINSIVPMPHNDMEPTTGTDIDYAGHTWFNILHIFPKRIDLGNILSTNLIPMQIYNGFFTDKTLVDFINGAGAGTSIPDLPGLPTTLFRQRSLTFTLEVSPDGVAVIDATLDFQTDEPYLLVVPITGTRIVMFPFEPEASLRERLLFSTDVLESLDGGEQRISLRQAPRQEWDFRLMREDGPERQRYDLLMFDWHARVFGVPVWTEPSFLTAAATSGQTSISTTTTAFGDFRVGGLACIYRDEQYFESHEVTSVSTNTINLNTPLGRDFDAGSRVMPMRLCVVSDAAREARWANAISEYQLRMRVLDNERDLSDTTGWPTFQSRILLSDPNAMEGQTMHGTLDRPITVFDGGTGKFSQGTLWDRSKRGSAKGFVTTTREQLWRVRRLLHHLRGKQIAFFMPTFGSDLTLATSYTSGGAALEIVNVGYSRYARQRNPKYQFRLTLKNGTTYTRLITDSAEVDSDVEQIQLSNTIPESFTPDDVRRMEFYELVRIDSDDITIEHMDTNGTAHVSFPVRVVFE